MQTLAKYDAIADDLSQEISKAGSETTPIHRLVADSGTALGTHIGVRRNRNDDRIGVAKVKNPGGFTYQISVVCDGVGSSKLGNQAASIALASVVSFFAKLSAYKKPQHIVADAIRHADEQVRVRLRGEGTTTLSVCVTSDDGEIALASIGDSRIYSWAPFGDLIQLSVDDTIENELRDLKMKASELLDEKRLRGSLSQAIGESGRSAYDLKIDVIDRKQIPPGILVIATDGIWSNSETAFQLLMRNCGTPYDVVRRALTAAAWLGGADNASIIVIGDNASAESAPATVSKSSRVTLWLPGSTLVVLADSTDQAPLMAPKPSLNSVPTGASPPPKSPVKRKRKSKAKQPRKQDQLPLDGDPEKESPKERAARKIDAGPDE